VSKIVMGEVRKPEPSAGQCIHKLSVPRSADLKSAVSQDCILLGLGVAWGVEKTRHAADFKSAMRQSATLRYGRRNHRQLVDAPSAGRWKTFPGTPNLDDAIFWFSVRLESSEIVRAPTCPRNSRNLLSASFRSWVLRDRRNSLPPLLRNAY
jgi:hypothetical protein